ncbi:MAG: translation factor, partial [Ghiorsea sp.]
MAVCAKLKTVKASQLLKNGQVLAQQTSTLAGIAASPYSTQGIRRLQHFKQRKAPFLLLADSISTA